jgi:hypothetical protein
VSSPQVQPPRVKDEEVSNNTTGKQIKVEQTSESSNATPNNAVIAPMPIKSESMPAAGVVKTEENLRSPPKKKIKLEVRETQAMPEVKESVFSQDDRAVNPTLEKNTTEGTKSSQANSSKSPEAMVLDHGADGEDDAVAQVVEEPAKVNKSTKPKASKPALKKEQTVLSHSSAFIQKKNNAAALRTVRMPPMSSPGLLIPPGIYRGPADANGLVSPNAVFTDAMDKAGYNIESRTKDPHRGSSVQRVVDDMYDSDVKLCLRFPELVPRKFLDKGDEANDTLTEEKKAKEKGKSSLEKTTNADSTLLNGNSSSKSSEKLSVAERLMKAFQPSTESAKEWPQMEGKRLGKRSRVRPFSEMIPVSLTLPYPEEYIATRLAYIKLVNEREVAIAGRQEEEEGIEIEREKCDLARLEYPGLTEPKIVIPPIPLPPNPPKLEEMQGMDTSLYCNKDHPFYMPNEELVEHLDKRCFHITEGRYFGLTSCGLADQHFVGPNAPGIGGLHLSSMSGLATYTTTGSANGVPVFNPPSTLAGPKTSAALGIVSAKTSVKSPSTTKTAPAPVITKVQESHPPKVISSDQQNGPTVNSSRHHLKLIMENGGEEAEEMRMVIIKAAIHAFRADKFTDRSFRGLDRKVYPDVAKAFSTHSGLKPCAKCRSNKQGTIHCRLRRKHQEPDHDGGDSWKIIEPLLAAPLGTLLVKPLKKKSNSAGTT